MPAYLLPILGLSSTTPDLTTFNDIPIPYEQNTTRSQLHPPFPAPAGFRGPEEG